jgi:hypothetical protein
MTSPRAPRRGRARRCLGALADLGPFPLVVAALITVLLLLAAGRGLL